MTYDQVGFCNRYSAPVGPNWYIVRVRCFKYADLQRVNFPEKTLALDYSIAKEGQRMRSYLT